ncbi:TetR/AcrR family transcriptional regulator [Streptomyces sp. NPDC051018]|uniref:TetR/AcrR family transcriptional regulator n=1 Tax=Streptomyces sp. NPDC051018 TaxID=3365639 RepID=UPI003796BBF0
MGRPREFDETQAVDAASRVFWSKGYEATSTQDLCDATGLGRSSIYNTFTSKHHLFLRALTHYAGTMTDRQARLLDEGAGTGLERIRALLALIVRSEMESREGGVSVGCFTVNTLTALAARDAGVAEVLEKDLRRRLALLRAVVEDGRRDGSITSARDAEGLAWYLVSVISGMRVAAQAGAGRVELDQIAAAGVDALSP